MTVLLTIKKIAELSNCAESTSRRQAEREKWLFIKKVTNGWRKREVRLYPLSSLPKKIQALYLQADTLNCNKPLILPQTEELNQDRAKELIDRYESSPEWCKKIAWAKDESRKSYETFSKNKKKVFSKIEFSRLYNSRNKSLGITDEVFDLIPKMSKSKLKKIISKYKTEGLAGLLPSKDRGKPRCKINDEMREYVISLIKNNPGIRAIRVYEYLKNKFSGTGYPEVTGRTVRNFITRWKVENKELYCYMVSPDKWRSQYKAAFGSLSQGVEGFLSRLELDATVADILCADGRRWKITVIIDVFSRKVKFLLVLVHSCLVIACTLLHWVCSHWGIPYSIVTDNGREYTAKHLDLLCESLNINHVVLPPFSPELKGFVERIIESVSVGLLEELPGFVGHNIQQRKNIEARKSFAQRMFTKGELIECKLKPDELQKHLDDWTENVYHQKTHSELGMSPEQKASQSPHGVRKIEDERILDILLAPGGSRWVSKKGISFENGRYAAVELAGYIGQRVQLRLDLANAGKLYVFDMESKFVCIAEDTALKPFTVEEARAAEKRQKNRIKEKEKAIKILSEPDENPMIEHLEVKRKAPGQIRAFIPEVPFENKHTVEARKALDAENAEPVSTYDPGLEIEEMSEKVIRIKKKEDDFKKEVLFTSERQRYEHLENKDPCTWTEEERLWMDYYKQTSEYKLFKSFEQQNIRSISHE